MLIPWSFQHNDLIRKMASADCINKKKLTNILNHLHFKGEHLYALLNHPRYEEEILVIAHPEPCLGEELTCRWDQAYQSYNLGNYPFRYLIVAHGQSIILVPARIRRIDRDGLMVELPEKSLVISKRRSPRFACHAVKAELWQNGFQAEGDLIDFNPHAFHIRVQTSSSSTFRWFDTDSPVTIRLFNGQALFSGNCRCMYLKQDGLKREIVVTPLQEGRQRLQGKTMRNPRKQSFPAFYALFEHPFMKKRVQREIFDISSSGFSILDKTAEAVLIPGMIIPDTTITYAGMLKIHCKVQVIYRKDEGEEVVRFGLAILDMDLKNYNALNQLVNNIPGAEEGMINEVDLEQLWELFFETNFIYPGKYKYIQTFRDSFQETYRKLYEENPEIAKHFTYQKNGRIYSHISMIRAYERAWLLHHHAARAQNGRHTGLVVLKKMIGYLFDMRRFPSGNLDYFMCYYRPENRFTNRVYSEFAREKDNPGLCSLDLFTYLPYTTQEALPSLPEGWSLRRGSASDLWEFERFYKHNSGGLLWNVLFSDLHAQVEPLEKTYARLGLVRRWQVFALHNVDDLKAIIIMEESDVALNLSDLLNGVKVMVMDRTIPMDVIYTAVGHVTKNHATGSLPLLIYPSDYTQDKNLPSEKHYALWILDAQIGNEFVEYLECKFRTSMI